jgi:prepilin-type N-terminal cleavage/methylation domain-containing protein
MKARAFTLIELLVVIAIIAILAAILFPVFAQAKSAAKKAVSISNMKQVALSTQLYMSDSDDILPPLRWFNPSDLSIPSTHGFYFYPVLLQPYTKNVEMFLDPTDRGDDPAMRFSACPGAARFDKGGCAYWYLTGAFPSYGYNRRYLNILTSGSFGAITYTGVSATSLGSPAETVMFAEATGKDLISPSQPIVRNDVGYHRVDPPSFWLPAASADPAARPFDARLQGQLWGRYDRRKVIVNWLDGHTKYVPIDSLVGQGTTVAERDRFWNGNGNQ